MPRLRSLLLALLLAVCGCSRTAVLIKTHKPTTAMLARFCHLASEQQRATGEHAHQVEVLVQYYLPDNASLALPYRAWCGGKLRVFPIQLSNLTDAFGVDLGARAAHGVSHRLSSLQELAFHALHRSVVHYDTLWVLEQDVAWQGRLFDSLAAFDWMPEEYLCHNVHETVNSTANSNLDFYNVHSGWANPLKNHTKCFMFVARYSRSFLDQLVDQFLHKGDWAQGEWFASTVCKHGHRLPRPRGEPPFEPCQVGDLAAVPSVLARGCFQWNNGGGCPLAPGGGPPRAWVYNASAPPQLFHPLKW